MTVAITLEVFFKEKLNLVDVMLGLIRNLKNKYNLQVQYLHCDNAGGNVAFKKACKQDGLVVDFDYTAPDMPQWNGCIKQNITTLFNWVHAMLNNGKFNAYLQNGLYAKAAKTTMLL